MKIIRVVFLLMLLTTPSAPQWISQYTTDKNLLAVQILDIGVGYTVGESGTVFRLNNFGSPPWQDVKPPATPSPPFSFYDVCFINENEGWVVGNESKIYVTTDGCKSWAPPPTKFPSLIPVTLFACERCTDNSLDLIWVGGEDNFQGRTELYRTGNKGQVWDPAFSGISGVVKDVTFVDVRKGYATTSDGIFVTANAGANWSQIQEVIGSFNKVIISSNASGWTAGSSGRIFYSPQLSSSWLDVSPAKYNNTNFNAIAAITDEKVYVVGLSGLVLLSTDKGKTWAEVTLNTNVEKRDLNDIFALDQDNIWIVGDNGANYYSEGYIKLDPNSIQRSEVGELLDISFESVFNSLVDIQYRSNPGSSWITEASQYLASKKSYPWKLPSNPSKSYQLRIRSSQKQQVEAISVPFEIYRKSLSLESPEPGTTLGGGTQVRIKWQDENVDFISLRLNVQGELDLILIENYDGHKEEYDWAVPEITKNDRCQLYIFETKDRSPIDSSGFFTIIYDAEPPDIFCDTSLIQAKKDQDLIINATITDVSPITNTLYYRQGGDGDKDYRNKPMELIADSLYQATILAHEGDEFTINERGVEWYIKAVDSNGNDTTFGTFDMPICTPVILESLKYIIESSIPGKDVYQMVSIPYKSYNTNVIDIFGSYDPKNWRLWIWSGEQSDYKEIKSGNLERGKSYWLASISDNFTTGKGQSYKPEYLTIKLNSGWNQIGNPFAFPVRYADIIAANDMSGLEPFHAFDKTTGWFPVTVLEPKQGYFIKNQRQNEVDLKIPAIATSTPSGYLTRPQFSVNEWEMKLIINSEHVIDAYNFLGFNQTANDKWDHLDYPDPPPVPGKYISLYFPHPDWEKYPDNYTTDFRPSVEKVQIWEFVVATNAANSEAKIRFEGITSIPEQLEILLIDKIFNISQDLRQNPEYSFPILSDNYKKSLRIAVGKQEYFTEKDLQTHQIPQDFELFQNFPNPFNRTTVIRYGLPVSEKITMKIFNVIGEEVILLEENNQRNAGYHVLIWDAMDRNGNVVPNGLYFFHMYVKGFCIRAIKMILIK